MGRGLARRKLSAKPCAGCVPAVCRPCARLSPGAHRPVVLPDDVHVHGVVTAPLCPATKQVFHDSKSAVEEAHMFTAVFQLYSFQVLVSKRCLWH